MPVRETEEDRKEQRRIAEDVARHWSVGSEENNHLYVHMCKPFYPVDAALERKGRIVGFLEVKARKFEFRGPRPLGYKNFWLSASKVSTAINHADIWKKPCKLIASFTDGIFVTEIDAFEKDDNGVPMIVWGGRSDRGDPNDMEPMFCYPWQAFIPLEMS